MVAKVREVLERYGLEPEIWITETGFSTWRHDEHGQLRAFLKAIANAINTLSSDSSLCTALATKSRTRALELTPQRMVLGYLEAYEDLIAQR